MSYIPGLNFSFNLLKLSLIKNENALQLTLYLTKEYTGSSVGSDINLLGLPPEELVMTLSQSGDGNLCDSFLISFSVPHWAHSTWFVLRCTRS